MDENRNEAISLMHDVLKSIAKDLLKQDNSIIIAEEEADDYRRFVEILSLMAKQVNLCEGGLFLLEQNMEQEAYNLVRSHFNNLLWINYLLSETDGSHLKEFIAQPFISQINRNKQLMEVYKNQPESFKEVLKQALGGEVEDVLAQRSNDCKAEINRLGVGDKRTKSIVGLAKEESNLFDMYVTLYMEASKFEHSDISTTQMYRNEILPQYDKNHVFTLSLNTHNSDEWHIVFGYAVMCIFLSYNAIRERICSTERHLFEEVAGLKGAYDEVALMGIIGKIAIVQGMISGNKVVSEDQITIDNGKR